MNFNTQKQIFSFRKYKAYGLASAVIASMFLAQGVVSADVVTTPDGTKTTLSNDKASVTVDSNHFKESNDKTAKELYEAKEYEADKVTTGKDTVTDESKTVVSYETENGTKLKEDITKTATEEKQLEYKVEGTSGKEYTGTSTTTSTVTAELEKQDTIEKDGEKYKYVRTETTQGKETVLTETNFNDVETKASVEGMHNEDGSIKYDKIKDGSRVWVLEEKEDGTYGNYALIENVQGLSDEKIQEAAKTATTKFSKAEVEKLGGIKETDSIVVYETNTYAARKQTSEQFGKDFYYGFTANSSNFYKSYIDDIYKVGLDGLEKQGDKYIYKGQEVPTIEDFKTIYDAPSDGSEELGEYLTDESNKYYTKSSGVYVVPTTYYDVLSDFLIAHPDSPIFAGKAKEIFWGNGEEEYYFNVAFVARLLNNSFKSKYNLNIDTQNFSNKPLDSKAEGSRPTEKKTYSFVRTDLKGDADTFMTALYGTDDDIWKHEIGSSYSPENIEKVRRWVKGYKSMNSESVTDPFNNKPTSEITQQEYIEAVFNNVVNFYLSTYKNQLTPEQIKELRSKFGDSVFNTIGNRVGADIENPETYVIYGSGSNVFRNSLGVVTENTELFTYHDVITPLRAYRLNADNNTVRHIYEQVKRGSVIATHKDTDGNELLPQESIKTNEYDGEAYTTSAKQIPNKVVTDTTPEGFTRTTTTTYTLVENPANKDGNVIGGETITVPYVYRPIKDVRINGSVIATYSTQDGEKLTDDVAVKTDAPEQEDYDTSAKEFASKTETSDVNGLTKTTITRYELIGTPANKRGFVVGNQTITVPYVYRKVITESINGSVIATYKDTEGNVLAPQESVKTNVPDKEAYTTSPKVIPDVVTTDTDANGFTRKTTKVYTLVETPNNQNGSVVGGTVTTVPYVYNVKTIVETNGSVIATHKDTEGNELAPQENVKTNEPSGLPYTTSSKEIPDKVETDKTPDGLTRVTTTHYELVENPSNKDGNIIGGETVTVPYVYKPVKSVQVNGSVIATYTTEDGEKLADDVAVKTDAPSGEAYTTERKTFDNVTKEEDVNGFTRLTTTRYELINTPTNADGQVEADQIIYVPYVYRKVVTVELDGGVIATHKDTDGNELSPTEVIKSHSPEGDVYKTKAKSFDPVVTTDTVDGLTRTTTTTYELVETPTNANGQVKGGETIKVPYVYRKVVKQEINGSVVVTHHDENGVQLALDEKVKDNAKAGEPYTTSPKQFDSSITTNHVNGLTQKVFARYELVRIPANDSGEVEGGKTLIVPYIYHRVESISTYGSVVTTYKDTEGNELAPQVDVKTDVEPGQAYDTEVKRFPIQTLSESKPTDDVVKVTVTEYRLVKTPENKSGKVKDGQVIVVPYVYEKVVSVHYEKKDTLKPKFEIPNYAPKVDKEEVKFTRFMLEDRRTTVKDMEDGFVGPDDVIGSYTYTGVTDSDEGGAVITHIYRQLKPSEMSKIPNESPIHDKPELNVGVIPNDAPNTSNPELKVTRFVLEDGVTEVQGSVTGLVDAPTLIGKYVFTGKTELDASGSVRTHIYKLVEGSIPNDAPILEKPELKIPEKEVPTPDVPKPETPVAEVEKPSQPVAQKPQEKFATKELPNTGTEVSQSSALGILGLVSSLGLLGFVNKKKETEDKD